jgi:hypothetical protein
MERQARKLDMRSHGSLATEPLFPVSHFVYAVRQWNQPNITNRIAAQDGIPMQAYTICPYHVPFHAGAFAKGDIAWCENM